MLDRAASVSTETPDPVPHEQGRPNVDAAPVRSPGTLTAAGDLLRALAAPVRISIVLQLRESERCVHELVDVLGVAQPLISQHLRVLKSAGSSKANGTGVRSCTAWSMNTCRISWWTPWRTWRRLVVDDHHEPHPARHRRGP
ncbi:hypothetical protein GCM10029964_021120 [Kibdelosporangium lantanae]